ncbi:unnamed protein product [Periconia digitata]|uniref:Uncharacterized protein n=1 Tax=Periconia digitata TaxID=1303443 RepID=A0A9W4UKN8_9PLEO|nr:unnamed protein product [Periconia digitata]
MSSGQIPAHVLRPLTLLYDIYYTAISWFPRPPVRLITHNIHYHPFPLIPHPVSVYTLYAHSRGDKSDPPTPNLLPSTLSLTTLFVEKRKLPYPIQLADMHTLIEAYKHMSMCDFSVQVFLPPLRTLLSPYGIEVQSFFLVPLLHSENEAFFLQKHRTAAFFQRDKKDSSATDGIIWALHCVFLITFPASTSDGKAEEYIADFSLPQFGILHERNWILPKEEYLERFAVRGTGEVLDEREDDEWVPDEARDEERFEADGGKSARFIRWWRPIGVAAAERCGEELKRGELGSRKRQRAMVMAEVTGALWYEKGD